MRSFVLVLAVLTGWTACVAETNACGWCAYATAAFDGVVVSNGSAAVGQDISCRWKALRDGVPVAMGAFPVAKLKPGAVVTNGVPHIVRSVGAKGGEMALRVSFSRHVENADGDVEKTLLKTEQVDFPVTAPRTLPPNDGWPSVETRADELVFKTKELVYAFDRRTGLLRHLTTAGFFTRAWIKSPVSLVSDFAGAPELLRFSTPTNLAEGTVFTTLVRWRNATAAGELDVVTRWTIREDGVLQHVSEARLSDPDETFAGPIGYRIALADADPLVAFFGRGNARDAKPEAGGDLLGQWTVEPPKDAGGVRTDVRALAFDPGASHLSVLATETPFTFDYRPGKASEIVLRTQAAPTNGVVRFAFAIAPGKRLTSVAVPPAPLPLPAPRGESAAGKLPFAKFHELPASVRAKGLLVRSAKDAVGRVKGFTFEGSEDGRIWSPVFSGELADRAGWQQADFKEPVAMRWWRFEAVTGHGDVREASVAEIKVVTE